MALSISISLIVCEGEGSSNDNDNSMENVTGEVIEDNISDDRNRIVPTPSGLVTIEPGFSGPNSVEVTVPDGRTFNNSCDGGPASIVVNDFEVDVCR